MSGLVQCTVAVLSEVLSADSSVVSSDVLSAALFARFRSRRDHTFAEQVLSAMRYKFGGHVERK